MSTPKPIVTNVIKKTPNVMLVTLGKSMILKGKQGIVTMLRVFKSVIG